MTCVPQRPKVVPAGRPSVGLRELSAVSAALLLKGRQCPGHSLVEPVSFVSTSSLSRWRAESTAVHLTHFESLLPSRQDIRELTSGLLPRLPSTSWAVQGASLPVLRTVFPRMVLSCAWEGSPRPSGPRSSASFFSQLSPA